MKIKHGNVIKLNGQHFLAFRVSNPRGNKDGGYVTCQNEMGKIETLKGNDIGDAEILAGQEAMPVIKEHFYG